MTDDDKTKNARVPTELHCPMCNTLHVDQDDWAHKIAHRKHLCAQCGHVWAPYDVGTIGVDFHVACRTRRDELLQMVTTLSQSVPLESEVGEALNQRGVLLAEVATLKSTNEQLVTMIGELQTALKSVCDVATTPLPEDRQTVLAASRLANKAVPL